MRALLLCAAAAVAAARTPYQLEPDGSVTIEGEGAAYFRECDGEGQLCRRSEQLTMRDFAVQSDGSIY